MGNSSQDGSQARRVFKDAHYPLYLVLLVLRDQYYCYSKCYLQTILNQDSLRQHFV
jgi:hypothetical protein